MVIYVVKANFQSGLLPRRNPTSARVARGLGLWLFLSWIETPMLPKQVCCTRQIRYGTDFVRICLAIRGKSVFFSISQRQGIVKPFGWDRQRLRPCAGAENGFQFKFHLDFCCIFDINDRLFAFLPYGKRLLPSCGNAHPLHQW